MELIRNYKAIYSVINIMGSFPVLGFVWRTVSPGHYSSPVLEVRYWCYRCYWQLGMSVHWPLINWNTHDKLQNLVKCTGF